MARSCALLVAFLAVLVMLPGCEQMEPEPEVELPEPLLRRLTEAQYLHAVEDLFGEDLFVPTGLEPDLRARPSARRRTRPDALNVRSGYAPYTPRRAAR